MFDGVADDGDRCADIDPGCNGCRLEIRRVDLQDREVVLLAAGEDLLDEMDFSVVRLHPDRILGIFCFNHVVIRDNNPVAMDNESRRDIGMPAIAAIALVDLPDHDHAWQALAIKFCPAQDGTFRLEVVYPVGAPWLELLGNLEG